MGAFGGYYKGERKKKKKGSVKPVFTSPFSPPVFSMPEVVSKKKKPA